MGSGRSRCRRTWLASGHDRSARAWRIRLVERRRLSVGQLRRRYPGSAAQPAWAAGAGGRLLGWVCRDAAGGELSPGIASAVVLVDIVPNMDLAGASRIHAFMAERVESGFGSLDEVADVIANYNPHRPRPSDPDGLVANLRRRGDRWYWHWDPQFIGGIAAFPPVEVTDVDRMNAAVATILRDEVPVLLVRGQVSDIVRQESADQFLSRFPQVEFTDVRGAGHMVAGDRNDAFAGAVLDFLARHVGVR